MKVSVVLGTRPEIIKLSPVIRELNRLGVDFFVLHTGQHYSYNMDRVFFEQLKLSDAKYNLDVGSGTHAEQTGKMLIGIEKVLMEDKPDIVLVEGDTNTVLAGALAAAKLSIMVGHVEAGLRSYDWQMPEEINRVLSDHCSDLLFAPTEKSKQILLGEGISGYKVFVTGNTVVDAIRQNLGIAMKGVGALSHLGLKEIGYFLVTVHRPENVDDGKRFRSILRGLELVSAKFGLPVVYPIHPRAKKQIEVFGLKAEGVRLVEPLDYLGFLELESKAKLVLTDSGGVQEETCVLKVPCVTLRYNTERPETLEVESNVLAGTDPAQIVDSVEQMLSKERSWGNPYGAGDTGEKIVAIILERFSRIG